MNKVFWSGLVSVLLAIWVVFPIVSYLTASDPFNLFIDSFVATGILLAGGGCITMFIGALKEVNK